MSLLGLDVGTTGCKASAFSADGHVIASAYEEYDNKRPQPGWAELDARAVWQQVKGVLAAVAPETRSDPVTALAVSSLGEAMVPVTAAREILGPSLLNFDVRGEEYLDDLARALPDDHLYHPPVAERTARQEGVGHVVLESVLRIEHARNAPLGVIAVGLP